MGIRFYLEDRLRSALENLAYRLADELAQQIYPTELRPPETI